MERKVTEQQILESSVTKTAKISGRLPRTILIVSTVERKVYFRFYPFTTCNYGWSSSIDWNEF